MINYEKELNPEQLAVVTGAEGPSLVLAGAGSGKTRTIVYRVAYLLERGTPTPVATGVRGVRPERILLLTFTNKAAGEMMTRIDALLSRSKIDGDGNQPLAISDKPPSGGQSRVLGGTFHSVAHRLLRRYGETIGLNRGFSILDEEDSRGLLKTCLKEAAPSGEKFLPSPAALSAVISFSRNSGSSLAEALELKYAKYDNFASLIEKIAAAYANKKRAANTLDFDDLLVNLHALLKIEEARRRLSGQFQYILVDEYQDTNWLQAEIARFLASARDNLLVVGDDAQSIYSFRAANIGNILNFKKTYPQAKIFRLETNYRSTPEILDLANDIIAKNRRQFPKNLKTPPKVPSEHLGGQAAPLAKPLVVPCANELKEAVYVVDHLLALRRAGVPFKEMAVLFRAAFHSQALEMELRKRGIAYEYRGGLKFFERAHVKDALAFLRVYANWRDEAAWRRILALWPGIGPQTADKIFALLRGAGSFSEALKIDVAAAAPNRALSGWQDLLSVLKSFGTGKKSPAVSEVEPPGNLLRAVISSKYADYLESEYADFGDRLDDLEQLAAFATSTSSGQAAEAGNLTDFLAETSLYDSHGLLGAEAEESGKGKLVLSTIHQAKGLEWDAVFVIHMTADGFPNRRAIFEDGGLEEERRLFYVAVTRARRHLFLTYPLTGVSLNVSEPSMFLDELDEALVHRKFISSELLLGDSEKDNGGEEAMMELDDLGEARHVIKKTPRRNFLPEIDEL